MPEEIEVETKDLEETIEEVREERKELKEEEKQFSWTRWISLSTALLAVVAAVAALQAGSLSNDSLAKMSEAGINQARASDEWAYYQAKGIKGLIANQSAETLSGNPAQAQAADRWKKEADRYKSDQGEIQTKAKEFEAKRDDDAHEANELMHHHHIFAFCVTFTQVAIALSAIAALTKRKYMWYISLLVGIAGAIYFIDGFASRQIAQEVKAPSAAQEQPASPGKAPHGTAPKQE